MRNQFGVENMHVARTKRQNIGAPRPTGGHSPTRHSRPSNVRATVLEAAVAYYSWNPPILPMYLIPLSSQETQKPGGTERQLLKVKCYEAKRIVHKVLVSIVNRAARIAETPLTKTTLGNGVARCNVAIQTKSCEIHKQDVEEDQDNFSSSSGAWGEGSGLAVQCPWAGDMRALRDSHVRLVLRQLRQLRDIDRLDRALRRNTRPLTI